MAPRPGPAANADATDREVRMPVAAAARRLGVAPATLRTWDRRYGIGPSDRRAGQHRRYTSADLTRLEAMRQLLVEGATAAEAASAALRSAPAPSPRQHHPPAAGSPGPPGRPDPPSGAPEVRQLREAALRMDADRLMTLLDGAVRQRGVPAVWEELLRPVLADLGARWAHEGTCIAEEHLLTECVTRLFGAVRHERAVAAVRPVLLLCGPGEAHVLPLHALAAALAERAEPSRLLDSATPPDALATAVRRLRPAAVTVWAHAPATARPELFTAVPRTHGGHQLLAAGPGWAGATLPRRVIAVGSLSAALAALGNAGS